MKANIKYMIRAALLVVIIVLGYLTFESIAEPVRYSKEVIKKEAAVIQKLKIIREAQLAYREVNGKFAASFDTLTDFMKNGQLKVIRAYGDRDDSTTVFKQEIILVSVRDSLFRDVDIDNIPYVPGHENVEFKIEANMIKKNNVPVPVFQVTDPKPFSKIRIRENNPLRVGDIYDTDYNGNWGNR